MLSTALHDHMCLPAVCLTPPAAHMCTCLSYLTSPPPSPCTGTAPVIAFNTIMCNFTSDPCCGKCGSSSACVAKPLCVPKRALYLEEQLCSLKSSVSTSTLARLWHGDVPVAGLSVLPLKRTLGCTYSRPSASWHHASQHQLTCPHRGTRRTSATTAARA
jgi:hypothetical protein